MKSFNYISSNHSSDPEIIRFRIEYYLEKDDFSLTAEDVTVNIFFENDLTKNDVFKLDLTMVSLGYVRP